ncbi:polysaccharide deacetylase family protein [Peptoniphilus sp. ING2-D1G]|nr:polysaccharide deacetylase family protein [Peptoniphilus sp. ING2-D1G]
MYSDNIDNESIQSAKIRQMRRRRKIEKRKKTIRRRRILALIAIVLVIFLIYKGISGLFNKKETVSIEGSLPAWYIGVVSQQKTQGFYVAPESYNSQKSKFLSAYDKATTLNMKIVPGSNHVTSAINYAYDTAQIRTYIRGEVEYTGAQKLVFLTFDDGPNNIITPQILDILDKNDVHATFFLLGSDINEAHQGVLNRMLLEGNGIGIHSFSHVYEELYPDNAANPSKIIEEAKLSQNRLQNIFGEDFVSHVWRYPGGHMSWNNTIESDAILKENGFEWIDWNCMSGDAEPEDKRPKSGEEAAAFVDATLNKNLHNEVAVVLMHDSKNKTNTVNHLQSIIDYFKDKDYKFGILK